MARARSHGLIHLPESRCTGPLARYAQLRYHSHGHSVLGSGSAAGQPQARADSDSTERPGTGRPACHWPAYPRGRPGRGRGSTVTVQASEVGLAAVTVTAWPQHFLPVLHSADHRNVTGSQLRLAGGPGGPVSVTRQPPCSRPGESLPGTVGGPPAVGQLACHPGRVTAVHTARNLKCRGGRPH